MDSKSALNAFLIASCGMSMIENLQMIRTLGMEAFVIQEQARWRCSQCGRVVCVHRGVCYDCGKRKEEIILLE